MSLLARPWAYEALGAAVCVIGLDLWRNGLSGQFRNMNVRGVSSGKYLTGLRKKMRSQ
jgi:hypothetical protein